MSESEPIRLRPRARGSQGHGGLPLGQSGPAQGQGGTLQPVARFNRAELQLILDLYGRMVAAGEWRDYALDMGREKAVFSVFRRSSEVPLYRIEKVPRLARKQGAYAVVAAGGLVLKRGHELPRVLEALDRKLRVV